MRLLVSLSSPSEKRIDPTIALSSFSIVDPCSKIYAAEAIKIMARRGLLGKCEEEKFDDIIKFKRCSNENLSENWYSPDD